MSADAYPVVSRPLRWCLTGLVGAGVGLAVTAAILSFAHHDVGDGIVYLAVSVGLSLVTAGTARSVRWITALILVVCAGQIAAVIGTVLELVYGVAPVKAAQLRRLGLTPKLGVAVNLLYSTVAFGLFCWYVWRWRRGRRPR